MFTPLEAAAAKYDRAAEDLGAHHKKSRDFFDGDPYRVVIKFESDTSWHVARVQIVEDPPPSLSVLVGNIAYQLLSAINLLAWELAAREVGRDALQQRKVAQQVQFPIAKDWADFRSYPVLKLVSDAAVAVFESLQPYKRPHGPAGPKQHHLFLVKELADSDKHRVITASYGAADFTGVRLIRDDEPGGGREVELCFKPGEVLEHDANLVKVRFEVRNAEAQVRVDPKPTPQILFESNNWSFGRLEIGNCVSEIGRDVAKLAPLFPGESWSPISHDTTSGRPT